MFNVFSVSTALLLLASPVAAIKVGNTSPPEPSFHESTALQQSLSVASKHASATPFEKELLQINATIHPHVTESALDITTTATTFKNTFEITRAEHHQPLESHPVFSL